MRDWYPEKHYCEQDLSINTHLGAAGAMSTGRVQDPEGAKTIILSFKTAAGAVAAIQRQTLKIVCFTDTNPCRLMVDILATLGGKQDGSKQGKRMILIYKSNMHSTSSMNPTQCTQRTDRNARQKWLITTLRQLEQYQPTTDPPTHFNSDADMGDQEQPTQHHGTQDPQQHEHHNKEGSHQIHTGDTIPLVDATTPPQGQSGAPTTATRLSFGAPDPPRPRGKQSPQGPTEPTTHRRYIPQGREHHSGTYLDRELNMAADPTTKIVSDSASAHSQEPQEHTPTPAIAGARTLSR